MTKISTPEINNPHNFAEDNPPSSSKLSIRWGAPTVTLITPSQNNPQGKPYYKTDEFTPTQTTVAPAGPS